VEKKARKRGAKKNGGDVEWGDEKSNGRKRSGVGLVSLSVEREE